jgi:hypothetical protein
VTGARRTSPFAVAALPEKRSCERRNPTRAASAGDRTTSDAPLSTRNASSTPLTVAGTTNRPLPPPSTTIVLEPAESVGAAVPVGLG